MTEELKNVPLNPISGEDDTTAKWKEFGTGTAFYKEKLLKNQPFSWGFLENRVNGDHVFQTFSTFDGTSRTWSRSGNASGWYSNSAKWVANKAIVSTNSNYPDYSDNWKWVKYNDGTFTAEYKLFTTTDEMEFPAAAGEIKCAKLAVRLPIRIKNLDVPKWGISSNSEGAVWITGAGLEPEEIKATVMQMGTEGKMFSMCIGCTVTGRWK